MKLVAVALVCAGFSAPAGAATYYYVGGVYEFSNHVTTYAPQPLFATGVMEIDESKLPEGEDIASREYTIQRPDAYGDPSRPYWLSLELKNQAGGTIGLNKDDGFTGLIYAGSTIKFGSDGKPQDWNFEVRYPGAQGETFVGSGGRGRDFDVSPVFDPWGGEPNERQDGERFLTGLGYTPGTKTFDKLLNENVWRNGHDGNRPGRWYDNAIDFAAAVERAVRFAIGNPPSNIYSIPACRVSDAAFAVMDYSLA